MARLAKKHYEDKDKINIGFEPVSRQQEEFMESRAKHKLLIGGYGSGKTYPAIHETLLCAYDNQGHQIAILRNTWDSLVENVEKEFIEIATDVGAIKSWDKTRHDLILTCDTTICFRPLSMSRAQLKVLYICMFFIDDPDVNRHKETISFLFSRLRNRHVKAKYFQSIICANYEGHDWLWQTYMRGKKQGGNGKFAYWICPTTSNPTLPEDFVEDLEAMHSERWMQRFVYCNIDQSYTGLVYDEFNPTVHCKDLQWCIDDNSLTKILSLYVCVS